MNMGHFHKKEPTGKTLLQRKAQWAGLSKNSENRKWRHKSLSVRSHSLRRYFGLADYNKKSQCMHLI